MTDQILEKQVSESDLYNIDFDPLLAASDTISAVTSVTAAPTGLTVGTPTFSDKVVQVRLSAGTDLTLYKITAIVTTALGNTKETDVYLRVEDR